MFNKGKRKNGFGLLCTSVRHVWSNSSKHDVCDFPFIM